MNCILKCAQFTATTLKPLTGEENNTDLPVTTQCNTNLNTLMAMALPNSSDKNFPDLSPIEYPQDASEPPTSHLTGPGGSAANVPAPDSTGRPQKACVHVSAGQSCFGSMKGTHAGLGGWC